MNEVKLPSLQVVAHNHEAAHGEVPGVGDRLEDEADEVVVQAAAGRTRDSHEGLGALVGLEVGVHGLEGVSL